MRLAASSTEVHAAFSGPADPPRSAQRRVDGRAVRYEAGAAGDWRITWDGAGDFHLSATRDLVLAWAPDGPSPAWTRFLLDSVLASAALRRGAEALHAGTVALPGGAVAVAAGQGGGKTTLLGTLLAQGAALVADDVSVLARRDGGFAVEPAPPVLNVARERPAGAPAPADLGEVLAELGDELWVLAARPADTAQPLRAVVHLERRAGAALGLHRRPPSPIALLRHLLDSGPGAERGRERFELVADLAESVPFVVLRAPLDAPPPQLAELVAGLVGEDDRGTASA